jgi:hypothetical protein
MSIGSNDETGEILPVEADVVDPGANDEEEPRAPSEVSAAMPGALAGAAELALPPQPAPEAARTATAPRTTTARMAPPRTSPRWRDGNDPITRRL